MALIRCAPLVGLAISSATVSSMPVAMTLHLVGLPESMAVRLKVSHPP